jgi:hypothetical protein
LRSLVGEAPVAIAVDDHEIRNLLTEGITRQDIETGIDAALAKQGFRPRYYSQLVGWIRRAAQDRLAKAPAKRTAAEPISPSDRDDGFRLMLRRFREYPGTWPPKMGNRPDEPGCVIPAHILAEFGFTAQVAA